MSGSPRGRRGSLWREEFSIHAGEERYVTRRQFARFLVLTSFGMFVGNLWILGKSWLFRTPVHPMTRVGSLADLPVGGSRVFHYPTPDDPCLLIRTAEDTVAAFSQKCTHLSCAVFYAPERGRIECPCHNGVFSARDGRVLQGPPPRPLPRVVLERRGDDLIAVGVAEGDEE